MPVLETQVNKNEVSKAQINIEVVNEEQSVCDEKRIEGDKIPINQPTSIVIVPDEESDFENCNSELECKEKIGNIDEDEVHNDIDAPQLNGPSKSQKIEDGYKHCMKSLMKNMTENIDCDTNDVSLSLDETLKPDTNLQDKYIIEVPEEDEDEYKSISGFEEGPEENIDKDFCLSQDVFNDMSSTDDSKLIMICEDKGNEIKKCIVSEIVADTGLSYHSVSTLAAKNIK